MRWGLAGLVAAGFSVAGLAPAVAQQVSLDFTPDTARILGDPSYLPLAGQVEGSFSYTYEAHVYKDVTAPFYDPYYTDDRASNQFAPLLSYGITDDISVSANWGFGNNRLKQTYVAYFYPAPSLRQSVTGHASFHSVGADDPDFGVTWRAIDQRAAPVSVDLSLHYAPDIFTARNAGHNNTGSIAAGGQTASLEAAISRETRWLTLRAYGQFTYDSRNDVRDPSDGNAYRYGAHPVYSAGLDSELRLVPWAAINLGIDAAKSVQYDQQFQFYYQDFFNPPSLVKQSNTVKPGGSLSPYVGAVVPIWRNHLAAEFRYQHDFYNYSKLDSGAFGPDTEYTYNNESNLYTARLYFAF